MFQDRFKSEPIENNAQLLIVFRYILKNPEKAGICRANRYEWSSYHHYGSKSTFVDTEVLVGLLGNAANYRAFISEPDNDQCAEYLPSRITDSDAIEVLKNMGIESGTVIQSYTKEDRDDAITELLSNGLSIRQIERLTGICRGVIQRVKKKRQQ